MLLYSLNQNRSYAYSYCIWTASLPLPHSLAQLQLWAKDKEKRFIFLSRPLNDIIKMTDSFKKLWEPHPVKTNLIRFGNRVWWFVRGGREGGSRWGMQHKKVYVCKTGRGVLMRGGSALTVHGVLLEPVARTSGLSPAVTPSFLTSIRYPIPSVPHSFSLP